jgi:hypothetical protein
MATLETYGEAGLNHLFLDVLDIKKGTNLSHNSSSQVISHF